MLAGVDLIQLLPAVIGAIALVGIPAVAWFSRRATREGRLLLRIERLGSAYALLPDSLERTTFERHLTVAVAALNDWLDESNKARRRLERKIFWWSYSIGVILVTAYVALTPFKTNPWVTGLVEVVVAGLISLVTYGSSSLLSRRARKDAADRRMQAISRGESPA